MIAAAKIPARLHERVTILPHFEDGIGAIESVRQAS
jgi:hypothetical protein